MRIEIRTEVEVAKGAFFRDICGMVESMGRRDGVLLEVVASDANGRAYAGDASSAERLGELVGVHRAQVVRDGDHTGRIVTESVTVTVGDRKSRAVVRTYNYVMQRVTDHLSGESLPLAAALEGVGLPRRDGAG